MGSNSAGFSTDRGEDGMTHKCASTPQASTEQENVGENFQRSPLKPMRFPSSHYSENETNNVTSAKEIQSPRFQAILRVTSGHKKRSPDIKSFSHELNSKGVRPLPFWKSRGFGRMQEIRAMVRVKFGRLKEEVDKQDLGVFAGDLVGILETTSESHLEWRESLEDLLIVARQCAKMSPDEFWIKCEGIVQNLDDHRQELPMGTLKQFHTRLLFILTRCTRLVQFQKESGYEEDAHTHQLSDLGVYSERKSEATNQDLNRKQLNQEASAHTEWDLYRSSRLPFDVHRSL